MIEIILSLVFIFDVGLSIIPPGVVRRPVGQLGELPGRKWGKHYHKVLIEQSLKLKKIVQSYNKLIPPGVSSNETTPVTDLGIEVDILNFSDLSDVSMDYTFTAMVYQYWTDPRLAFDTKQPNEEMVISGDVVGNIWLPDTVFANDKSSMLHDITSSNKAIILRGNGEIMLQQKITTTLECKMDFRRYPHDDQTCKFLITSFGYPTNDVIMHWGRSKVIQQSDNEAVREAEKLDLPFIYLTSFKTNSYNESSYGSTKNSVLQITFRFSRRMGHFMLAVYIPSILIVTLSWANFWLDIETGSARIGLGITAALTMQWIDSNVRQTLPQVSYSKAIDIFLLTSFMFIYATVLEYMLVDYIYWIVRQRKIDERERKKEQEERLSWRSSKSSISSSRKINMNRTRSKKLNQRVSAYEKTTPFAQHNDHDDDHGNSLTKIPDSSDCDKYPCPYEHLHQTKGKNGGNAVTKQNERNSWYEEKGYNVLASKTAGDHERDDNDVWQKKKMDMIVRDVGRQNSLLSANYVTSLQRDGSNDYSTFYSTMQRAAMRDLWQPSYQDNCDDNNSESDSNSDSSSIDKILIEATSSPCDDMWQDAINNNRSSVLYDDYEIAQKFNGKKDLNSDRIMQKHISSTLRRRRRSRIHSGNRKGPPPTITKWNTWKLAKKHSKIFKKDENIILTPGLLQCIVRAFLSLNKYLTIEKRNERTIVGQLDKWSRLTLPILYVVFNIIYWAKYLNKPIQNLEGYHIIERVV